jgi:hypothetical protein
MTAMLLPGMLIVPVTGKRRRSRKVGALLLLVELFLIGSLLSCAGVSSGGGGGGTSPPPINPATYKVTVTGSSPDTPANAGHSVVVTLVVD